MKIVEITKSAARKVQHPFLPYSSIDSFIMLKAQLSDEDDVDICARELQARAEGLVQDDVNLTVNALSKLADVGKVDKIAFNLTDKIREDQKQLDKLRQDRNLVSVKQAMEQSDAAKGRSSGITQWVEPDTKPSTTSIPTAPGLD